MPIVVNSNASATEASFNLSRNNEALRKSLGRLSSGKRINNPADDAGGLAVAYKLNSTINRSYATIQNAQTHYHTYRFKTPLLQLSERY